MLDNLFSGMFDDIKPPAEPHTRPLTRSEFVKELNHRVAELKVVLNRMISVIEDKAA